MNEASGSPLTARQNPFIYLIILYLLIAIGILFLIVLILKIIQKYAVHNPFLCKDFGRIE